MKDKNGNDYFTPKAIAEDTEYWELFVDTFRHRLHLRLEDEGSANEARMRRRNSALAARSK